MWTSARGPCGTLVGKRWCRSATTRTSFPRTTLPTCWSGWVNRLVSVKAAMTARTVLAWAGGVASGWERMRGEHGTTRHGRSRPGKYAAGEARLGAAGHDTASQARHAMARHGADRLGRASQA